MQPGDNLVVTSADHHQHVAVKLGVVLQWMQQALEVSGTIQCTSSKQDLMLSLVCSVNFSLTQKSLCPLMDCSTWRSAQQETWQISRRWGSASGNVKGHKRRGDSVLSTCASQMQATDAHSLQVDAISVVKGLYQLSPHLISCNVFAVFFPKIWWYSMHNWDVCMCILYTYFQL